MKKNKITESIACWSAHELEGSLPEVIANMQNLIDKNPNHFEFRIDVETESGYYGSSSTNISIMAFRWETDEEMEQRIAAEKNKEEADRIKAARKRKESEQRERTLYESLRKKFEKEVNGG